VAAKKMMLEDKRVQEEWIDLTLTKPVKVQFSLGPVCVHARTHI
jgi:hypothetical protein